MQSFRCITTSSLSGMCVQVHRHGNAFDRKIMRLSEGDKLYPLDIWAACSLALSHSSMPKPLRTSTVIGLGMMSLSRSCVIGSRPGFVHFRMLGSSFVVLEV